jgi:hypothetical protein
LPIPGDACRNSPANRGNNLVEQFGLIQQRCPTTMAVDNFGRAAKIQVDARTAHGHQSGRIVGQTGRIRPQQLWSNRHTT